MHIAKAGAVGLLGALIILVVMILGIQITGLAPFNLSPSAAFLYALGLPPMPLALVLHFGVGFIGAAVLYLLFGRGINPLNGIGLALVQWLLLMVVAGPIIGWGFFGFGAPGHALSAEAPLLLGQTIKYVVLTFVLHVIYGGLNGTLIARWMGADGARTGRRRSGPGTR